MKKNIFLIIGLVFASLLVAVPITFAQNYGLDATAGAAFGGNIPEKDVATIIGNIIGTGLSLISVLFFIMMIYGGIMWMTARGKDEVSKKALDTIFAAIIGIIIVLAAYAITTFVFKAVGNTSPTSPTNVSAKSCSFATANVSTLCATIETKDECENGNEGFCQWIGLEGAPCIPFADDVSCKKKTTESDCKNLKGCVWK